MSVFQNLKPICIAVEQINMAATMTGNEEDIIATK